MGAAVRIGDAMLGRAPVASTLPAWAGTAATTLLNMVEMGGCEVSMCLASVNQSTWMDFEGCGSAEDVCVGVADEVTAMRN